MIWDKVEDMTSTELFTSNKLDEFLKNNSSVYVSITGLKVKSVWKVLYFFSHAVRSKMQADSAPGALFVGVKKINGIHHTLTAWESKKHMQDYIYKGHHLKAIQIFKKIATGKTFGYEARELPSWDEVHRLWLEQGKSY